VRVESAVLAAAMAIAISGPCQAQELPTIPRDAKLTAGGCRGSFFGKAGDREATRLAFDRDGNPTAEVSTETYAADLDRLSKAYVSGDWPVAILEARTLLNRLKTCPLVEAKQNDETGEPEQKEREQSSAPLFDLERDYVHLLWVSTVPAAADPTVFSMVVHTADMPAYSRVLPGLAGERPPRLLEVFLSENLDATVASFYVSKPLSDPLLDQVPQVVDKFLGPMFATFDRIGPSIPRILGEARDARTIRRPLIGYTIRTVVLPEARAGVEVTMRASQPVTRAQLEADVAKLAVALRVQGLSGPFATANRDVFRKLQGLMADMPDKECRATGSAVACKRVLHEAISDIMAAERRSVPADPLRRDLDRLEDALHAFVDGLKPTIVTGKASIDNSPLTHLTFGLLSSYAFYVGGSDLRAKVDGGKVVNAPLPRALQMVVLNMSVRGYQSKTTKRWIPEAFFQPFVGVVFSPDVGVAGGASFKLIANLGVNVGYAYMFIARPEDDLSFGAVLEEKIKDAQGKDTSEFRYPLELRQDPLQSGRLHTIFAGVSYNFK